ncbi:MAG: EVE domain-containing protein [Hyphomicrobiales bacterium]|nr:EVE domain-containing protein [Hyphomicrobiales bacterium]
MAHWLLKSEPDAWSFEQQLKKGAKGEPWTGVRNFTAKQNLKLMKKGEYAFFYHSNVGKEIVGIVEVIREAYPDPTDESGRFTAVDVKAVKPIPKPVPLVTLKGDPRFSEMALVKYSRLSVQPVTDREWRLICEMGGLADE